MQRGKPPSRIENSQILAEADSAKLARRVSSKDDRHIIKITIAQ